MRVHNALAKLYANQRLTRARMAGEYLYLSPSCQALQLDKHHPRSQKRLVHDETATGALIQNGIEETMCFLLANLNERQKCLYLGLESMKVGRGGDISDGQWHHVVLTLDTAGDGLLRLCVDGVLNVTSTLALTDIKAGAGKAMIGAADDDGNTRYFFNGHLADARIYDEALSENEVRSMYRACHQP